MPSHGSYHRTGSNHHSRRRSSRRSSTTSQLYTAEDTAKILDASREALKQAQQRHVRRRSGGYYYTIPRAETPEIPSYETFLAEARARDNGSDRTVYAAPRASPAAQYQQHRSTDHQFYPNPYLYGYPSGYYSEIRAPLHHTDSARTGKSGRSSTLVGSETQYSPTLVDSARPSLEQRANAVRATHARQLHHARPSHHSRQPHRRQQTRVSWGPTYTTHVEPEKTHVSNTGSPMSAPIPPAVASATTSAAVLDAAASDAAHQDDHTHSQTRDQAQQLDRKDSMSPVAPFSHSMPSTLSIFLLPSTPPPVNLSPANFITHKAHLTSRSTTQSQRARRARVNNARLAALARNGLPGSAGAGNDESDGSGWRSKWSPDNSPKNSPTNAVLMAPLAGLIRKISTSGKGRSRRKVVKVRFMEDEGSGDSCLL